MGSCVFGLVGDCWFCVCYFFYFLFFLVWCSRNLYACYMRCLVGGETFSFCRWCSALKNYIQNQQSNRYFCFLFRWCWCSFSGCAYFDHLHFKLYTYENTHAHSSETNNHKHIISVLDKLLYVFHWFFSGSRYPVHNIEFCSLFAVQLIPLNICHQHRLKVIVQCTVCQIIK